MGMILGYGLCSLFGLFYSAAHTVIPFLLLGIGIDNIFVITQTFNTLGEFSFLFWFFLSWRLFSRNYLNPCTSHWEVWPNYETCRFVLFPKIGKTLEKFSLQVLQFLWQHSQMWLHFLLVPTPFFRVFRVSAFMLLWLYLLFMRSKSPTLWLGLV